MSYILTLKTIDNNQREILLESPHEIVPSPADPKAVSWRDRDGNLHNVPWSSILEFYFSPQDYKKCRSEQNQTNKE